MRRPPAAWLAAAGAAAVALLPVAPIRDRLPGLDSGIFLYGGWLALSGGLPYRDHWDSKPPLIFALNAIGLALGRGEWGVWALEAVFLTAAVALCYRALRHEHERLPAALATAIWLPQLSALLEGGNMTEQYGLAFKFGVLWLVARGKRGARAAAAVGVLTAALFLLKQNLVAVSAAWAAATAFSLRRRPAEAARELGWSALGFGAVVGAVWLLFAAWGLAGELWQAAFVFNANNTTPGLASRLGSMADGARTAWPCVVPAVAGWLLAADRLAVRGPGALTPLTLVALIALPLELLASSVTGRSYHHYYIAWLPAFAVLTAFAASAALARPRLHAAFGVAAVLLIFFSLERWKDVLSDLQGAKPDPVVAYLRETTAPGDTVLAWGLGARYNFMAERVSPTRYSNPFPLLHRGYANDALCARFEADLRARPPAAIVDLSGVDFDFPPLDGAARRRWPGNSYYYLDPALDRRLAWLETLYEPAAAFGKIVVYRRRHG